MDELREKLIKILSEDNAYPDCANCQTPVGHCNRCVLERHADHLIANGVTVQQWIPVSERVPTEADANSGGKVLAHRKEGYSDTFYWKTVEDFPDWFTHWTPTHEPPKEV